MQKNTVCLTMEDAKQIYELFNACALAANVVDAFDRLKAMINSSTEQAEKKGE